MKTDKKKIIIVCKYLNKKYKSSEIMSSQIKEFFNPIYKIKKLTCVEQLKKETILEDDYIIFFTNTEITNREYFGAERNYEFLNNINHVNTIIVGLGDSKNNFKNTTKVNTFYQAIGFLNILVDDNLVNKNLLETPFLFNIKNIYALSEEQLEHRLIGLKSSNSRLKDLDIIYNSNIYTHNILEEYKLKCANNFDDKVASSNINFKIVEIFIDSIKIEIECSMWGLSFLGACKGKNYTEEQLYNFSKLFPNKTVEKIGKNELFIY